MNDLSFGEDTHCISLGYNHRGCGVCHFPLVDNVNKKVLFIHLLVIDKGLRNNTKQ